MIDVQISGEDSLLYLYLQKQYAWTLENFTLFNAYSTLLSGVYFVLQPYTVGNIYIKLLVISAIIPVFCLYVLGTKLQMSDMYLATAATGFRIIEKVGLAYSVYKWNFYVVKIIGCFVYTSEPLVRSQLSKIFPSEDLGKL